MPRPVSLAVQEYLVDWRTARWPADWASCFGRGAPLALEIGFGNGDFLSEQAVLHPERDHVGIEVSWTAATYLFRRLARARSENVRVLLGDAEVLVRELFAPGTLCEVTVNHPCPWPKSRHVERRLLDRAFLTVLGERMQPDARLTVVTDHAEYAAWLTEELAAQRVLESCHASAEVAAIAGRSRTRYQEKAMARGISIHYFEWRRPASAQPAPAVAPCEIPMPTLTLSGRVAPEELFRAFRPALFRETHREIEVVVKLECVYARPDAPIWLVEAFAREDRLRQRFALDVVLRDGTVLIKPAALGEPHPTHGVKRAVWCAGRWLQARHPGLSVRHESLGLADAPWPAPDAQE